MKHIRGKGYLGSNKIEVSTANQEIIPNPPSNWTYGYTLYKFTFKTYNDTNIIINGETNIFLRAEQEFQTDSGDAGIHSFVIVNSGVSYQWVGAY